MCWMMEDPSEDVMVGTVRSRWGNFSILEGLWEGSAFYLQRFVDLVGRIPADTGHEAMQSSVRALLGLSGLLCARVRLARHELGAEMPTDRLPSRKLSAWLLRRRHLRFSPSELAAAGIDARLLEPFVFDMKRKASLFGEGMGSSTLERKPLVRRGDYIYLVLPTAVSSAIRYFVIAELEERSEEHTSELQSLMRISYAVFCLKNKKLKQDYTSHMPTSALQHITNHTTIIIA